MNRITCWALGETEKAKALIECKDSKIQEGLRRLVNMPEARQLLENNVVSLEELQENCILWAAYMGRTKRQFNGSTIIESVRENLLPATMNLALQGFKA